MTESRPATGRLPRALLGMAVALGAAQSALVQAAWPERPVRFIVPYAAGGPVEGTIRIFSNTLPKFLGQPIIIEAKAGGNTVIGADFVAKSAPDGYTMLVMSPAHAANPALLGKLPYDSINDFAPVTIMASTTFLMLASPKLPANNIKELVALAKAKAEQLNFGIGGVGTPGHLTAAYFNSLAGTRVTYVPFKGAAPAYVALAAGQIDLLCSSTNGALPFLKAGRMKALGATGLKRESILPDLPTVAEQGFPGFESTQWVGIMAPARTPKAAIDQVHMAFVESLKTAEVHELLYSQGLDAGLQSPEEFGRYYRNEVAKWTKVIVEAGIKPE
mgnify:CR=1 FL=1